jgi:ubiquinone/menaquinone biosynthesis C-methylase UbiE
MNRCHGMLCRSGIWKRTLERDIFPWVFEGAQLGDEVLEIGPGPGLTTDLLRSRVKKLTAVEIDPSLASLLEQRLAGTNVTVLQQDATALQISSIGFDTAVCLIMLHHVPSAELQDRLLSEVARVLRPGSSFIGCDLLFRSRLIWRTCSIPRCPLTRKDFLRDSVPPASKTFASIFAVARCVSTLAELEPGIKESRGLSHSACEDNLAESPLARDSRTMQTASAISFALLLPRRKGHSLPCIDNVVKASAAYTAGQWEMIRDEMAEPRAFAA